MNIVEAYIKFNNKLIILISGLSGSGKTKIASNIERDFKIKKIDIELYCKKDFDKKIKLPNGVVITDWDDVDAYDWDAINSEIEKNKQNGIVLCGPYLPKNKLKSDPDFHIHIKIPKQTLIEVRKIYVQNNQDKCEELNGLETLIINQATYPHYLKYMKESEKDIHKYINSKDITIDKIYDDTADFLFYAIDKYLTEYNKSAKNDFKSSDSSLTTSSSIKSDDEVFLGTTHHQELERQYY